MTGHLGLQLLQLGAGSPVPVAHLPLLGAAHLQLHLQAEHPLKFSVVGTLLFIFRTSSEILLWLTTAYFYLNRSANAIMANCPL